MSGFGGQVKSQAPRKKGKSKKRGAPPPKPAVAAAAHPAVTAEQAQEAHMDAIRQAVERHALSIADGLEAQGFAVVDDFMSGEMVATMRAEAVALLSAGHMAPSQSTRHDEARGEVVSYEKHNVLSTNLGGGEAYHMSPRMHEYCVALVSSLAPQVRGACVTRA